MERCPRTNKAVLPFLKAKQIHKKTLRWKPDREKADMTMYHCQHCHGWHIGHDDGSRTRYDIKERKRRERYGF